MFDYISLSVLKMSHITNEDVEKERLLLFLDTKILFSFSFFINEIFS